MSDWWYLPIVIVGSGILWFIGDVLWPRFDEWMSRERPEKRRLK